MGIYNISGVDLSENELRVLDKGLKFAPACNLSKFVSLQKFVRTLNIKRYFLSKPGERLACANPTVSLGIHSNLAKKSV